MYITENQNIGESVLFLLSARTTLAEMVEDSNHKNADVMINFLINEASDYEIVSLLTIGALPDEKYNPVAEAYVFSMLKEQVLRNTGTINEMMGEKSFNDFITKVDSVYPTMSTNVPVLEFFAAQNPQIYGAVILSELERGGLGHVIKGKQAAIAAKMNAAKNAKAGFEGPMGGTHKIPTGPGEHPLVTQAKGHLYDIKAGAEKAANTGLAKLKALAHQGQEGAAQLGAKLSHFATSPQGMAVGGAALAALLAYAAAKTYKRFFSKAAGACRGMSGASKTDCMNKFRGRAIMAQAADLQRGMASCVKSKNPAACKSAVGGKIERLKAKAAKAAG